MTALTALLATSTIVGPAKAIDWPENYQDWSTCADSSSIYCIQDVKSDTDGNDTTTWTSIPSTIDVHAYFYNLGFNGTTLPNFTFNITNDGLQELDPALPTGSKVHLEFNLGTWNPRADFSNATNKILNWDTQKIGDNWILTIDLETAPYSFATECWPWSDPWTDTNTGESGDYCNNPRNRHDYLSYAQVAVGSDPSDPNHPNTSPNAGVWIANNATGSGSPWLDPTTKTLQMEYAGPPTKIDGSPNFIFAQAFIPDHTLSDLYGLDPTSVDLTRSFNVTRKDGSSTSALNTTIVHTSGSIPGILINIPEIITYVQASAQTLKVRNVVADTKDTSKTHPKITIKIGNARPNAPSKSAIMQIRANNKFAVMYLKIPNFTENVQPMCTKGNLKKYGTTMMATGTATVKLTKGTWSCKVRSVKTSGKLKLYSAWSKTRTVRIRLLP